ncbi:MAG: glycoside hydrolase family 65 protein [Rhodospirillum sp.]|nr:glycoside hydrolase family 65 protein [Rhodospirillum sp.]MCF8501644.1 glycoside hydrolase family 65 protein [Rhodospirillum sp.]
MTDWTLRYEGFNDAEQGLREALCALGNGYFCSRGAFPWVSADDAVHYPATYLSGGYNRARTKVADRWVENEDLVALPDWSAIDIVLDGQSLDPLTAGILENTQEVDLKAGVLRQKTLIQDPKGRRISIEAERLVSMDDMHLAIQHLSVTAVGWSGTVRLFARLEGNVRNWGVARYRDLECRHLTVEEATCKALDDGQGKAVGETLALLVTRFTQSNLRVALAADLRVVSAPGKVALADTVWSTGCAKVASASLADGETLAVEKVVVLYTGRDRAITDPALSALEAIAAAPDGATLKARHGAAWRHLWTMVDITMDCGDAQVQPVLRLHLFHLLQSLSPHTTDLDIGVPARGWHGEAYRGHVFWDELMILPVLDYGIPEIAAATIKYRTRRLPKARAAAAADGLRGAMFPWQSGSDGREESQLLHLNPNSGRWLPDNTWVQRHVSLAIAWNAHRHARVTGDRAFLIREAAPLLVEIARFFASLAWFNPETGRYEIHRVMGPDEFHDGFPGRPDEPGLRNNAYTNVLCAWLFATTPRVLAGLPAEDRRGVMERQGMTERELAHWMDMGRSMYVPFHDGDIISQFDGYETLKEFDWVGYRAKYGDIHRLDRILETEGDHANNYKVSKQADVLMLFYLFSREEISVVMEDLGYPPVTPEMWARNIEYYLARCSHGSTLSFVVHAWVMARSHPDLAWDYFKKALMSDVTDIQGGTTKEGIHLAAMAGSVDLVQRCFLGLEEVDGLLHFDPCMTDRIRSLETRVLYRGRWIAVSQSGGVLCLTAEEGGGHKPRVSVRGERRALAGGVAERFTL